MIVQIHRNIDDDDLTVQISVGRVKTYIDLVEDIGPAVKKAAEVMGGDPVEALEQLSTILRQMSALSGEIKKRVDMIKDDRVLHYTMGGREQIAQVDKFFELDALLQGGEILTHAEIYWLDWFIRKHKLLGGY